MPRPPDARHELHPTNEWQRRRYLLRHWRHREAQDHLLRSLLGWARPYVWRWRDWRTRRWRPPHVSRAGLLHHLHPGAILLDAGGAELFWLEQMLAGQARPTVVYRADIRLTAQFNYHPVETVWLLEQAGYCVQLLIAEGPIARPDGWYAPFARHIPGPWLLATPLNRQEAAP
jgi:hypothetical protein